MSAVTSLSWSDFTKSAASRRQNHSAWACTAQHEDTSGWSGTDTYAEALTLASHGWPEGTARIQRALDTLTFKTAHQRGQGTGWAMDVAGAFPCVPAYLAGDCEYMHAPDMDSQQAPTRRVLVSGMHAAMFTVEQVENYGLAVLALVDSMEQAGESIELVWHYTARNLERKPDGGHRAVTGWSSLQVTLKRAGEHFELDRLAFALAHPSMSRRLGFSVIEQRPELRGFSDAMGNAINEYPHDGREPGTIYLPFSFSMIDHLNTPEQALAAMQKALEL